MTQLGRDLTGVLRELDMFNILGWKNINSLLNIEFEQIGSIEKIIYDTIIKQDSLYRVGKLRDSLLHKYGAGAVGRIGLNLEEYWSLNNNLHFYMDLSKVNKPVLEDKLRVYKMIPKDKDVLIDYKIGDLYCYIVFQNTKVCVGQVDGIDKDYFCLNIHFACISKNGYFWSSGGTVFPEYNIDKLYSLEETENCINCVNKCNKVRLKARFLEDSGFADKKTFSYVYGSSKYMQKNGKCKALSTNIEGYMLKDLIDYGLYAVERYFNRSIKREETIIKNNEPKVYIKNTEFTVKTDDLNKELGSNYTQTEYITLRDYKRYTKKHKGTKHSYHHSPREHERRGTVRRIFNKDGTVKKVVPVKGSTVNRGKGNRPIYEIRDNKKE